MDARGSMQKWCRLALTIVVAWAASIGWTNAQTTEPFRLYGTHNVNRAYDNTNAYGSGSGTNLTTANRNQDTIYWERTRDQMRSQYAANTDRYSPNWGANDRVDSRVPTGSYGSASASSGSYNSGSYNSGSYNSGSFNSGSRIPGTGLYDARNQNYESDYNAKVPSFASGSAYVRPPRHCISLGILWDSLGSFGITMGLFWFWHDPVPFRASKEPSDIYFILFIHQNLGQSPKHPRNLPNVGPIPKNPEGSLSPINNLLRSFPIRIRIPVAVTDGIGTGIDRLRTTGTGCRNVKENANGSGSGKSNVNAISIWVVATVESSGPAAPTPDRASAPNCQVTYFLPIFEGSIPSLGYLWEALGGESTENQDHFKVVESTSMAIYFVINVTGCVAALNLNESLSFILLVRNWSLYDDKSHRTQSNDAMYSFRNSLVTSSTIKCGRINPFLEPVPSLLRRRLELEPS